MLTVLDVLSHVAEDIHGYSGLDADAAIDEFLRQFTLEFHLAITNDVEETELEYAQRYGRGHTYYFRLADYAHGKLLAGQMYWIFKGTRPDLDGYTGAQFAPGDKLYLFVHVQNVPIRD